MNTLGLPGACESVAVICGNCAQQLRAMSQSIVRPDIDAEAQRPTTLNAVRLARESLEEIERMLQIKGVVSDSNPVSEGVKVPSTPLKPTKRGRK